MKTINKCKVCGDNFDSCFKDKNICPGCTKTIRYKKNRSPFPRGNMATGMGGLDTAWNGDVRFYGNRLRDGFKTMKGDYDE